VALVNTQDAGELLWRATRDGGPLPAPLQGALAMDEAVRIQLEVLRRILATGERQAGWKIGLTADAVRAQFKTTSAVHGYLLASRRFPSGFHVHGHAGAPLSIESELCFRLGRDLDGPGITGADVVGALESIAPAFELLERRGDMLADLPLGVADNIRQWGYVVGTPVASGVVARDLGSVRAVTRKNGEVVVDALGRDAIDNQVASIAWLANSLSGFGRRLEAGHVIMSGSFHGALPVASGDEWEAEFSGVGTVRCTFA
jgi:2-keto-4-pentenoate hydratase